ncbi:MAG: DinB family protein [Anaerolineales bacterium]|jgi:FMN phosphatase YigB (HAD superfamily)|nr:DinB family protein [Anaerolineales bacterium]
MTLHLLLDLDDTLLNSNIEALIPVYFQRLTGYLAGQFPQDDLLTGLARGTRAMYTSADPLQTLEQVFNDIFYPPLGVPRGALAAEIDYFYDNIFPEFQPLTSPRPDAQAFVRWAFGRGFDVSVATDPLFPRKAILHRLRWADLTSDLTQFSLISDFETFHFAKISQSYYPEFLLRLGWDAEPVLMIGDSLERDIFPAQKAGLAAFWLRAEGQAEPEAESIPQGTFDDLRRWLEQVDLATLLPNFSNPQALLIALPASLAAIHTLTMTTPLDAWTVRPAPGEWALTEILCHLRDVEREVNLPRFQAALKDENAFVAGQDTDPWAEQRDYIHQDGLQAFADYAAARLELIALLKTLTPEQWNRKVRHTIFGPTRLNELAGFMLEHDQSHVRQAWESVRV